VRALDLGLGFGCSDEGVTTTADKKQSKAGGIVPSSTLLVCTMEKFTQG